MKTLLSFICSISTPFLLFSNTIFIPEPFEKGQVIEQVILISDVDGVVRESIVSVAHPKVVEAIKSLLSHPNVDITFISGSPVENNPNLEAWNEENLSLKKVFESCFTQEFYENRVSIFGLAGGHTLNNDGTKKPIDEYPPETCYELSKLLLRAFFQEVLTNGTKEQQKIALSLEHQLNSSELRSIASNIREHLDPNFRLINMGAIVETHFSNPPWNTSISYEWLKKELETSETFAHLPLNQKQLATGFAKKEGEGFNFLLISKTDKGRTIQKHLESKKKEFPNALIVTIGDSQIDFPMHKHAHLAFHVGPKKVWENNPLPNCILVRSSSGEDRQHIQGTLQVLALLEKGIGRSFYDLPYIPTENESGLLEYLSIRKLSAAQDD